MRSRIILVAVGTYGDVLPFLSVATSLRSRGHDVILMANPNFESLATGLDINIVPLGTTEDYDNTVHDPDLWHPERGLKLLLTMIADLPRLRMAYERLSALTEARQTVVVASTLAFFARLLQEQRGVSLVTVHLSPANFRSEWNAPKLPGLLRPHWQPRSLKRLLWWLVDRVGIDPLICPQLNAFRKELGLPPVKRVFHRWLHSPQRVIGLFPEWFAPHQPDWPLQTRLTGFPLFDNTNNLSLPAAVTQFLEQGEPPIVFTLGSGMAQGKRFFEESVKACESLGSRGLLMTHYPEQLPLKLPANVRHFDYIPFSQLLPHTAAIVHHGGIGTCSQALQAGVPQLIHPMAFDQLDNAARLEYLGVAKSITPRKYHAAKSATILRALIESPSVSKRCQAVAAKFDAADVLRDTCDLIEGVL